MRRRAGRTARVQNPIQSLFARRMLEDSYPEEWRRRAVRVVEQRTLEVRRVGEAARDDANGGDVLVEDVSVVNRVVADVARPDAPGSAEPQHSKHKVDSSAGLGGGVVLADETDTDR